jgi:hypothetical protein
MMDVRPIVLDLQLKGMNGREIYDDLVPTLPDNVPAYSTVTLWLREECLSRFSEPGHD